MTSPSPPYRESQEFITALKAQFAQANIDTHPRAASRWEHHISGVQRVLELLPYLEPHLSCPIHQARVLDVGCATGSASMAFSWRDYRQVIGLDPVMGPLGNSAPKHNT